MLVSPHGLKTNDMITTRRGQVEELSELFVTKQAGRAALDFKHQ